MDNVKVSIFNDVLGPVMRGPSSSHTAASFRLGRYLRSIFPGELKKVRVVFRRGQTFALTFRQQRSDLAFTAGFLGLDIRDAAYDQAREIASGRGLKIEFSDGELLWADHPNGLEMIAEGPGAPPLTLRGASVGGGSIQILGLNQWQLSSGADTYDLMVTGPLEAEGRAVELLESGPLFNRQRSGQAFFLRAALTAAPDERLKEALKMAGLEFWVAAPAALVVSGKPLFRGAAGLLAYCRERKVDIYQAGIDYESALTGLTFSEVNDHLDSLADIMLGSLAAGLAARESGMFLLHPSAGEILEAEAGRRLIFGGLHARTGARALAVMEHCSSGGLVCAAPTAGSAGIVPAVLAAIEETGPGDRTLLRRSLMAGAVVGLTFAQLATFAAEVGGCQVEVGASAAMAAGAAAAAGGGTEAQIFQAAGIMLQNYMGLICDPVKGYVELPCHIRNALAASTALTAVDLIFGGYFDPVPFDEAVSATLATGRLLPMEFRCTTLGGIAACPSMMNPKTA